jgi:hypothetical protein
LHNETIKWGHHNVDGERAWTKICQFSAGERTADIAFRMAAFKAQKAANLQILHPAGLHSSRHFLGVRHAGGRKRGRHGQRQMRRAMVRWMRRISPGLESFHQSHMLNNRALFLYEEGG